jgi:phage anti-repressor protein
MYELIKISSEVIGTQKLNSVNARDLHKTLEIKKDFSDWIKVQIKRAGLQININYIIFDSKSNGRPIREYIFTTESAKHIAMMSQGKKASEVRDYFIQIEEKYKLIVENQNIHELSGRVGGLTTSNNKLRNEVKKLKRKINSRVDVLEDDVNDLKYQQKLLPHKGLDEKLDVLFQRSNILANEKTDCFWQEAL